MEEGDKTMRMLLGVFLAGVVLIMLFAGNKTFREDTRNTIKNTGEYVRNIDVAENVSKAGNRFREVATGAVDRVRSAYKTKDDYRKPEPEPQPEPEPDVIEVEPGTDKEVDTEPNPVIVPPVPTRKTSVESRKKSFGRVVRRKKATTTPRTTKKAVRKAYKPKKRYVRRKPKTNPNCYKRDALGMCYARGKVYGDEGVVIMRGFVKVF